MPDQDSDLNNNIVASPCISVCALNGDNVCIGCYRTDVEITNWTILEPDQKRDVIRLAAQRRRADQPLLL